MAIVADTGGTSYDVSVVRRGHIPWTRETWLGRPYFGHMTGLPVGRRPQRWRGRRLDRPRRQRRAAARRARERRRRSRPGLLRRRRHAPDGDRCVRRTGLYRSRVTSSAAVRARRRRRARGDPCPGRRAARSRRARGGGGDRRARHRDAWCSAIEEITIHQGIDPRDAVLVGGGGAAGLNTVAIARRLGCPEVIVPPIGPALSAAGALISDLARSFEMTFRSTDRGFDYDGVNDVLARLEAKARAFIDGPGEGAIGSRIEFSVEARYPHQVWELESPVRGERVAGEAELGALCADFHAVHREVFSIADERSGIEFESWHARATCQLREPVSPRAEVVPGEVRHRDVYLAGRGLSPVPVWRLESVRPRSGPDRARHRGDRHDDRRHRPAARASAAARPARCTSCPARARQPHTEGVKHGRRPHGRHKQPARRGRAAA